MFLDIEIYDKSDINVIYVCNISCWTTNYWTWAASAPLDSCLSQPKEVSPLEEGGNTNWCAEVERLKHTGVVPHLNKAKTKGMAKKQICLQRRGLVVVVAWKELFGRVANIF